MRNDLLNEIDETRQRLHISDADFRPLPFTTDWHKLEERIYHSFCRIEGKARPIWLWERFKYGYQSLNLNVFTPDILNRLVPADELVLFMATDGSYFFFYEGKIEAIQKVLGERCYLDEYYIISKKLDWLFCENHHRILIGTGSFAIQQLRSFSRQFPELVTAAYPA
jgi:hypothetical protein